MRDMFGRVWRRKGIIGVIALPAALVFYVLTGWSRQWGSWEQFLDWLRW